MSSCCELSIACMQSSVGTYRSGMFCHWVLKTQGIDDPLIVFRDSSFGDISSRLRNLMRALEWKDRKQTLNTAVDSYQTK
jgi:hypothetical protein